MKFTPPLPPTTDIKWLLTFGGCSWILFLVGSLVGLFWRHLWSAEMLLVVSLTASGTTLLLGWDFIEVRRRLAVPIKPIIVCMLLGSIPLVVFIWRVIANRHHH